jgi:plastocyanin
MAAADGGCPAGYAGCVSFADATGPAASRVITFRDYEYTPKCLRVRAGQSVTFQGDFVVHPLRTSCAPERVLLESSGTSTTFTMRLPGFYGYYCLDHGNEIGQAMAGAVEVVP